MNWTILIGLNKTNRYNAKSIILLHFIITKKNVLCFHDTRRVSSTLNPVPIVIVHSASSFLRCSLSRIFTWFWGCSWSRSLTWFWGFFLACHGPSSDNCIFTWHAFQYESTWMDASKLCCHQPNSQFSLFPWPNLAGSTEGSRYFKQLSWLEEQFSEIARPEGQSATVYLLIKSPENKKSTY